MDKEQLFGLLDQFNLEVPSWGLGDTTTRLGRYRPSPTAGTIEEKLTHAGTVHKYTGCCPTVAVHVLWDFSVGVDATTTAKLAEQNGVKIGSVHPTLFGDPIYEYGSACSPDERARQHANRHVMDSIHIARAVGSHIISLGLADGTDFPGQDDLSARKQRLHGALRQWHDALPEGMTLHLQYKPFDPPAYHMDIADWGMAYVYAQAAGPDAKVVVNLSHHFPGQNVEQIVAFLLDEDMLGGIYLNDHPNADTDLTLGSIDPYAAFRIFHEVRSAAELQGRDPARLTYLLAHSRSRKPRIEGMIQAAVRAQELYAKACLVDRTKLQNAQARMNAIDAEQCLQEAFFADVRPLLAEWRKKHNLDPDPIAAYRGSGRQDPMVSEDRET